MSSPGDSRKRARSVSDADNNPPTVKRQRVLPPQASLMGMATELLLFIIGYIYEAMMPWDFIESSVFGYMITDDRLCGVDWEVRWRRILSYGCYCRMAMSTPSWDKILEHMSEIVLTLKSNPRVREFSESCHFTLFVPEIPDSAYHALEQNCFIDYLLQNTVDALVMMNRLTSFSLIAYDGKVQNSILRAFHGQVYPRITDFNLSISIYSAQQFAMLMQSFPRLKYFSIGSSDLVGDFDEDVFAAIVDLCPELETLDGLGSDAINECATFVTLFKNDNKFHTSLRCLILAYEYAVSWDDGDTDCIQLEFRHLEIFPSLLELYIQVEMEEHDTQDVVWSDTAAIKKLKEDATMFLKLQIERKKAINCTEGMDESELVALLVIENDAEPGVFIEETIRP
ncbi:hypothetical protein CYLTODRAFT_453097 [Cylindrobasidium torrendii FP15055 ss-10]|uniref:F-box domain-containing protein n=1 Tax=Cylindrobasidium torrendii FP15055 ss-10 TaxID=1314674 RepID=A0A0D7BH40_9AGAR|nr:hypothetical protein CYLTODRAFT_453097 [Cylindrobasidium torrendii FP15055 ss-10]